LTSIILVLSVCVCVQTLPYGTPVQHGPCQTVNTDIWSCPAGVPGSQWVHWCFSQLSLLSASAAVFTASSAARAAEHWFSDSQKPVYCNHAVSLPRL